MNRPTEKWWDRRYHIYQTWKRRRGLECWQQVRSAYLKTGTNRQTFYCKRLEHESAATCAKIIVESDTRLQQLFYYCHGQLKVQ